MDIPALLQKEVPSEYVDIISCMKFFSEPNISCSRFLGAALFTEDSLTQYKKDHDLETLVSTEMGDFLKKNLHEKIFLDIPCGQFALRDTEKDFQEIELLRALGVHEYIEVDNNVDVLCDRTLALIDLYRGGKYQQTHGISGFGKRKKGDMSIATIQDDLLGFLCKFSENVPKAIYISALQPDAEFFKDLSSQKDVGVPYLEALYKELDRICASSDLVILNSSDMLVAGIDEEVFPAIHPTIALAQKGFTLKRRCPQNKVQVFQKD